MRTHADSSAPAPLVPQPKASAASNLPTSRGMKINEQLNEMARVLSTTLPGQQHAHSESHADQQSLAVQSVSGITSDRATYVSQLNQVEIALSHLPEEDAFVHVRAPLIQQMEELKRKISGCRSLPAQIEGARNALARARERQQTASHGLLIAQKAHEAATIDVSKHEAELRDLETTFASEQHRTSKSNSLQRLEEEMKQVVQDMISSSNVTESELYESMNQMDLLFRGLVSVSQRARQNPQSGGAGVGRGNILQQLGAVPIQPVAVHPDAIMVNPLPSLVPLPETVDTPMEAAAGFATPGAAGGRH